MINDFELRGTVKAFVPAIDEVLEDGFSIGLHEISGVSGSAKTAFLLQMVSKNTDFPAIYLNTEMNNRNLMKRLVTISTKVELGKINSLQADERDSLVQRTRNANSHLRIEDGNAGFISVNYLRDRLLELSNSSPDTVILVIDSFNEWLETAKVGSTLTEKELRASLRSQLIDLSKELNVTIFISVQKKDSAKDIIEEIQFASNTHMEFSWERNGRVDQDGFTHLAIFWSKNREGKPNARKIVKFRGDLQEFS